MIYLRVGDGYEVVGFSPLTPCSPKTSGGRGPRTGEPIVTLQQMKDSGLFEIYKEFDVYHNGSWVPASLSDICELKYVVYVRTKIPADEKEISIGIMAQLDDRHFKDALSISSVEVEIISKTESLYELISKTSDRCPQCATVMHTSKCIACGYWNPDKE